MKVKIDFIKLYILGGDRMKVWENYKWSIILLISVIIGGIVGLIAGPRAEVVEPLGNLFLNLMFTAIVPLVFFSVASAIANMANMKRLGKILLSVFIVFTFTALIAAVIGVIGILIINPTKGVDPSTMQKIMANTVNEVQNKEKVSMLQQIVNTVTVSDFALLFSRKNMLQIIIFSIIFGVSTAMVGEKGKPVAKFLEAGSTVMIKMIDIIMYTAPIGLGCYFASVIGQLGPQIIEGYVRVFILYLILTLVYYFIMFSIYAYMSAGKTGVQLFWKNALAPSIISLATCSSAACIPVNLESTRNIGVPKDIRETVIPLGANTHKDGSVIGGVLKITFLLGLFGHDMTSFKAIITIIVVSYLIGAVMGAIPGGGLIGAMLIISIYGFAPEVLGIVAVISTIIDAPATLLNSTGNTVCAMMITRLVEGKEWAKKITA
ncbi:dicarboxylate/amino acid:cation symporter [Clostridium botulinum]|nr:dicarboxylate/amino acid:cation symporter [Clostridium botulinum]NEZ95625.1 dicarboxylate/amino acid:cation symporter [Clostridium botulinum]NFA09770.1 dicarboxylate/amino acid:cation symporter [Clostridium botulinum]NFA26405.1 dicarboxylate/amino acid:cation symporter [Clostridium botulinum]NFT14200.1 dicarboxylate/amino acid:cation symporter [Clostridium botulinum]